jgi:hypothetical protein
MTYETPPVPTEKELAAIAAVKAAIKALPPKIYIEIDTFDGTLEFWKRHGPGIAYGIGTPLKSKSKLKM